MTCGDVDGRVRHHVYEDSNVGHWMRSGISYRFRTLSHHYSAQSARNAESNVIEACRENGALLLNR